MSNLAFNLKNVSKSFHENHVLKNVDFSIEKGTIMGLVGKNGAGKSTMIKLLLGLLKPDGGEVQILGEPSWDIPVQTKHRIGYVPQKMIGFRWMKVKAMLDFTGSFYSNWDKEKVAQLLKEWDLDPWAKISQLSEGERQKLSIIQAIGHDPDLYIFDEPVASLDPIARRKFIKQLIDLNMNENKTMLFSTHITSDLERVAADVSLLKDGVITFKGDLSTLKDRIKRIHIQSNSGLPDQLPISNIISQKVNHKSAIVTVDGLQEDDLKYVESKFSAVLTVEQLNLEEIFLELNK